MKKPQLKRKAKQKQLDSRITNETVAEHREQILAGGRKFKYPHQYVKHRLVINAIIIAVVVLIGSIVVVWQQLYHAQNTSDFMYRVTRVAPLPVGSIDSESMRYSDYLMRYRSQELWLTTKGQVNLSGEDGKRQINFIKRNIMDGLIADMYAQKRANELRLTISEAEIDNVIEAGRETKTGKISQEVYDASTRDTLGFSPSEYRHLVRQSLVRKKVSFLIDKTATNSKEAVASALRAKPDSNLQELAQSLKGQSVTAEYGASGLVPVDNQDGGLSKVVGRLKDGALSDAIESSTGDGYYFVRRISGNNRQISYEFIHVPLTAFAEELKKVKSEGKVREYISIPVTATSEQVNQQQ